MGQPELLRPLYLALFSILVATSLYLNVVLEDTRRAITEKAAVFDMTSATNRPIESYSFLGLDFPRVLPIERPLVKMSVEESEFYDLDTPVADDEWLWTAPVGDNHVRLGPEHRTHAAPMIHELHCLRNLQRVVEYGLKESQAEHTHHCLTYIRQWVLCSADVALEPGDFATRDFEKERVGGTHTCRDWEPIYDFVRENWKEWVEYRTTREKDEL